MTMANVHPRGKRAWRREVRARVRGSRARIRAERNGRRHVALTFATVDHAVYSVRKRLDAQWTASNARRLICPGWQALAIKREEKREEKRKAAEVYALAASARAARYNAKRATAARGAVR